MQEQDDYLHHPDPDDEPTRHSGYRKSLSGIPVLNSAGPVSKSSSAFSGRGILNVAVLALLVGGLVGVFLFWPVGTWIKDLTDHDLTYGWNIGGTNASGQVPEIASFPALVDKDTPDEGQSWTSWDGRDYDLVFSDEFNTVRFLLTCPLLELNNRSLAGHFTKEMILIGMIVPCFISVN